MNIADIIKTAGTAAVTAAFPPAAALIPVINAFLGDDDKLPDNATGHQVDDALARLRPEDRATILQLQLQADIEDSRSWAAVQDALSRADAAGASTRPRIAMMMAWLVVLQVFTLCIALAVAVGESSDPLQVLTDMWPLILTAMGTPVWLLRSYFGLRTREKENRYRVATGNAPQAGMADVLRSVFSKP